MSSATRWPWCGRRASASRACPTPFATCRAAGGGRPPGGAAPGSRGSFLEKASTVAVKQDEDPRRFLHPATIARILRLDLRARFVVEGFISGMHKSPFFGHSVEFVQHREYTSGDDIRHLDWKVWSKTDRYYIKQFEAETNLRCTLVVDVSESMHYGRGPLDKYEYACTVAACVAYLLLRQQYSVGLITFDHDVRRAGPRHSGLARGD